LIKKRNDILEKITIKNITSETSEIVSTGKLKEDSLVLENLLGRKNVVFLGAPRIGKTSLICEIIKKKNGLIITSNIEYNKIENMMLKMGISEIKKKLKKIDEIEDIPNEKLIFIDDFYRVFLDYQDKPKLLEKLNLLISSGEEGICISTTPYRLEWLKWLRDKQEVDICFPRNAKEKLYKIEEDIAKKIFGNMNKKIKEKINNISQDAKKYIKKSKYTYMPLNRKFKYTTYVPFFAVGTIGEITYHALGNKESFLKSLITEAPDTTLDMISHSFKMFFSTGAMPAALAAGSSAAIGIGGACMLYDLVKGDRARVNDMAKQVKSLENVSPTDIEMIEAKEGLQPLTLSGMKIILQPEWQAKIEKEIGQVGGIKEKLKELERQIEQKYDYGIKQVDERFFKQMCEITKSIKKIEEMAEETRELVRYWEDITDITPNSFLEKTKPGPQIIPPEDIVTDEYLDKLVDKCIKTAEEKAVVITGFAGSGKSILLYLIWKKLKEKGYGIGLINEGKSITDIHLKKNFFLLYDDLQERSNIEIILSFTGAIKKVILTCRTEEYEDIKNFIKCHLRPEYLRAIEEIKIESKEKVEIDGKEISRFKSYKEMLKNHLKLNGISWDEQSLDVAVESSEYLPVYLLEFAKNFKSQFNSDCLTVEIAEKLPKGVLELFGIIFYSKFVSAVDEQGKKLPKKSSLASLMAIVNTSSMMLHKTHFEKLEEEMNEIFGDENRFPEGLLNYSDEKETLSVPYTYWKNAIDIESLNKINSESWKRELAELKKCIVDVKVELDKKEKKLEDTVIETTRKTFDYLKERFGYDKTLYNSYALLGINCIYNYPDTYNKILPNNFLRIIKELKNEDEKYKKTLFLVADAYCDTGSIGVYRANYDKALNEFQTALGISEEINNVRGISDIYFWMGKISWLTGELDNAMKNLSESLNIAMETGNTSGVAKATTEMGNVCYLRGEYNEGLKYYKKSLGAYEKLGDRYEIARIYGNMGATYNAMGDHVRAVEWCDKCINIGRKEGEFREVGYGLISAADDYIMFDQLDKAKEYTDEALNIFTEFEEKRGIAFCYRGYGIIYHKKGKWDKCIGCFEKAIKKFIEIGELDGLSIVYFDYGKIFADKNDKEKMRELFQKSIKCYMKLGNNAGVEEVRREIRKL